MIDLRYFSIENNQISGDIPDLLVSWKDLEFFNARKNRLSGSIPSYIGDLHKLQEVDLSSNLITGKIPATMGGLKDLRTLRVENNQMAGTFVDDLDSCQSKERRRVVISPGLTPPVFRHRSETRLQAYRSE